MKGTGLKKRFWQCPASPAGTARTARGQLNVASGLLSLASKVVCTSANRRAVRISWCMTCNVDVGRCRVNRNIAIGLRMHKTHLEAVYECLPRETSTATEEPMADSSTQSEAFHLINTSSSPKNKKNKINENFRVEWIVHGSKRSVCKFSSVSSLKFIPI